MSKIKEYAEALKAIVSSLLEVARRPFTGKLGIKEWAEKNIVFTGNISIIDQPFRFKNFKRLGMEDFERYLPEIEQNLETVIELDKTNEIQGRTTFCLVMAGYYLSQGKSVYLVSNATNRVGTRVVVEQVRQFMKCIKSLKIIKTKKNKIRFSNGTLLCIQVGDNVVRYATTLVYISEGARCLGQEEKTRTFAKDGKIIRLV